MSSQTSAQGAAPTPTLKPVSDDPAPGGAASPAGRGQTTGQKGALRVALLVMFAFFLLAPMAIYPVFLMKVMCFALFACAFNLLLGFGGLLSFGHAMFFGTAGYISAHLAKVGLTLGGFELAPVIGGAKLFSVQVPLLLSLPPLGPASAILLGALVSTLLGLLAGSLAIRRQGIYFAMITLALSQLVYFIYLQAPFTGGEDGIQSVPRGKLFGAVDLSEPMSMYWLVFTVFFAGFLLIWRIVDSPFGQILKAIRENEPRTTSLGFDTDRYKLMAFVLSAGIAGLAGGTKSLVFQLASLTDVHWSMSGEVVLMTLLGGMGTLFGPVVGAAIIVTMQNYLAVRFGAWVTVVQGVIFVICVLAFRRGVIGEISNWLKKPL